MFNGFLAALVYSALIPFLANSLPASFTSSPELIKSIASGLIFSALIRLKLTTITLKDGTEMPLGVEIIYNAARDSCFGELNRIVRNMRLEESRSMAASKSLDELQIIAKGIVEADSLKTTKDKEACKLWIFKTANDPDSSPEEKKMAFAEFISYGFDENF